MPNLNLSFYLIFGFLIFGTLNIVSGNHLGHQFSNLVDDLHIPDGCFRTLVDDFSLCCQFSLADGSKKIDLEFNRCNSFIRFYQADQSHGDRRIGKRGDGSSVSNPIRIGQLFLRWHLDSRFSFSNL